MGLKKLYLLDTNIISEPTKQNPSAKVLSSLDEKGMFCVIGAPTWYEILKGYYPLQESRKKDELFNYAHDYVQRLFPILPYDEHAASLQAHIFAKMKENGTPVPIVDAQIAAIALANNLILVTRNVKDFEPITKEFSLCVDNWFE